MPEIEINMRLSIMACLTGHILQMAHKKCITKIKAWITTRLRIIKSWQRYSKKWWWYVLFNMLKLHMDLEEHRGLVSTPGIPAPTLHTMWAFLPPSKCGLDQNPGISSQRQWQSHRCGCSKKWITALDCSRTV